MSNASGITFINVIDVDPGKQAEVIDILKEGTETVISKRPGFISVTLLASNFGQQGWSTRSQYCEMEIHGRCKSDADRPSVSGICKTYSSHCEGNAWVIRNRW